MAIKTHFTHNKHTSWDKLHQPFIYCLSIVYRFRIQQFPRFFKFALNKGEYMFFITSFNFFLPLRKGVFIDHNKEFIILTSNRFFDTIVFLNVVYDCPFDYVPHHRSFVQFQGYMRWYLMIWKILILLDIKKEKVSSIDYLSFLGQKIDIFTCQSKFLS